jgi:hypothetical protein
MIAKDSQKYAGKYVATRSFKGQKVIASGDDPVTVFEEAIQIGAKNPVIVFVPVPGMVAVYPCLW